MSPSHKQSEENYEYFYDDIKKELTQEGGFQRATEVRILDKFLDKKFINKTYYKNSLKKAIMKDKYYEKQELLSSLLISASILLFFLIAFIPQKETFIRILFGIYILCIYLIAYMFYK